MPLLDTDRRAQLLRKLTEVSRALTYTVSLNEVLDLAVKRAAEMLEAGEAVLMLTNEEGLLSVRASFGLPAALCERFQEPLQETLATRLGGLFHESGKDHFLAVPLVVGGAVTGVLAVSRLRKSDSVEEEEWLLSALADQAAVALEKTRLDETAVFRERLLGIVSHDLRNPISAISMATHVLLQRDNLDASTAQIVLRIQRSAWRAGRMVGDLLDYTQTRLGGGIAIDPKPIDLAAVIRQVVEELQLAQPERCIEVALHGDGHGVWDFERLAQALGNLLANALHYSPAASVVRVTMNNAGHEVVLAVHNVGPVIAPDRLPHIFEPMQRATSQLTNVARSVGLGLYIVKSIVEAHRGRVSAESTSEAGTTITLVLPCAAAERR
ncbi:MAG: ATP-binding protein [Myxococcota bacterium]|nr:ATP-binding protein [Myxococcota bacterium]